MSDETIYPIYVHGYGDRNEIVYLANYGKVIYTPYQGFFRDINQYDVKMTSITVIVTLIKGKGIKMTLI